MPEADKVASGSSKTCMSSVSSVELVPTQLQSQDLSLRCTTLGRRSPMRSPKRSAGGSTELDPTQLLNQEVSMYRCTSDTSLEIYSTATSGVQMVDENTNYSEKYVSGDNTDDASIAIESESENLGFSGKSSQILESFNLDDFWHALILGKYTFTTFL